METVSVETANAIPSGQEMIVAVLKLRTSAWGLTIQSSVLDTASVNVINVTVTLTLMELSLLVCIVKNFLVSLNLAN